MFSLSCISF